MQARCIDYASASARSVSASACSFSCYPWPPKAAVVSSCRQAPHLCLHLSSQLFCALPDFTSPDGTPQSGPCQHLPSTPSSTLIPLECHALGLFLWAPWQVNGRNAQGHSATICALTDSSHGISQASSSHTGHPFNPSETFKICRKQAYGDGLFLSFNRTDEGPYRALEGKGPLSLA